MQYPAGKITNLVGCDDAECNPGNNSPQRIFEADCFVTIYEQAPFGCFEHPVNTCETAGEYEAGRIENCKLKVELREEITYVICIEKFVKDEAECTYKQQELYNVENFAMI